MKQNEMELWGYEADLELVMENPKDNELRSRAKKPVQYALLIGDGNQGLLLDELDMVSFDLNVHLEKMA